MKPDELTEGSADTQNQATAPQAGSVIVWVHEGDSNRETNDWVAEEHPVALEFNGVAHAVMLATPADLEDFALGFALTEGIIDSPEQCFDTEVTQSTQGITVKLNIAAACFVRLKEKRRNLAGRTGCGLCGTESLSQVVRPLKNLNNGVANNTLIPASSIKKALSTLKQHQTLQLQTGATHAAAWFNQQGQLQLVREDVGRHNALDKLIGAGVGSKVSSWRQGMLLITSRASMEMVQKTIISGFTVLIAISAPTRLAIELAQQHGLCLIGFARQDKWTIYCHQERLAH